MRIPTEFVHNNHTYQIRQMSAITQLLVAQKIAPLVIPMLQMGLNEGVMERLRGSDGNKADILDAMLPNIERIMAVMAKMPEQDLQYIYRECLRHLLRSGGSESGMGWQEVWNEQNNRPLFDDIQGFDILILSVEVVKDQLENFMSGVLSMLPNSERQEPIMNQ